MLLSYSTGSGNTKPQLTQLKFGQSCLEFALYDNVMQYLLFILAANHNNFIFKTIESEVTKHSSIILLLSKSIQTVILFLFDFYSA